MAWDDGLDGVAYEIASSNEKIIRVIAGPGTGKTFSLKHRLARFLEEGVKPKNILLVTFTRVAAQDLTKAIEGLKIDVTENINKGTLHAFCNSILSLNQVNEITNRIPRMLLDFEKKFLLQDLSSKEFGSLYDRIERLRAFEAAWARRQDEEPGWPNNQIDQHFNYALQDWLKFHKSMLIGELIPRTLQFLRNNPQNEILQRYSHVFIDEYQDLNRAEQSLLDLLSENASIMVIGDEDQSIYETLKYAHPEGISQFHITHENTYDISIEECRRCPKKIVIIANSLIQNNMYRKKRSLLPREENSQGIIHIVQWPSLDEEINGVVEYVSRHVHSGDFVPGEVLILSPRRHVGYLIRDGLRNAGIDAHSFFREPLLDVNPKDGDLCQKLEAFSILLLLDNPLDAVALRCLLGYGSSTLRSAGYQRLRNYSNENNLTTIDALNAALDGTIKIPYITNILNRFCFIRQKIEELAHLDDKAIFEHLFPSHETWSLPFRELLDEKISDDKFSLSEVIRIIKEQTTQPETPMDASFVRVMSLQKSKGLSAKHVIVTNFIQGLIPTLKQRNPAWRQRELEEQRRLFYVAITRSEETLLLTNSSTIQYDLAMLMGAIFHNFVGDNLVQTLTSDFKEDLGPSSPSVLRGQAFIY